MASLQLSNQIDSSSNPGEVFHVNSCVGSSHALFGSSHAHTHTDTHTHIHSRLEAAAPRTPVKRRKRKAPGAPRSSPKRRRSEAPLNDEEPPLPDDAEFNPEAIV